VSVSFKVNNFDLIRLFAAVQVALIHIVTHLKIEQLYNLVAILKYFPGVPVFFVVSGFLISKSWQVSPSFSTYFRNRALRIFPALWVCLIISVCIFIAAGVRPASFKEFSIWLIAQISIGQFYNPDFLRGFGVGVINGSLWTIPVELQFYFVLPFIYLACKDKLYRWIIFVIVAMALLFSSRYFISDKHTTIQKLLSVSLVPYIFYFIVGIVARHIFELRPNIFANTLHYYLGLYVLSILLHKYFHIGGITGNYLNVVQIILLGLLTVSAAYSLPSISDKLLAKNDISYGLYIYHMPIVNVLIFLGFKGVSSGILAIFAAVVMSFLSWRLIERPALHMKKNALILDR